MGDNKGYVRNLDERGSVSISEEVIAVIAAVAAVDVEGIHGLYASSGKVLTKMIGRKGLSKGVKLSVEGDNVAIEINVFAEFGVAVNEVGAEVQREVISAVESAVGIKVNAVNVRICGISLK